MAAEPTVVRVRPGIQALRWLHETIQQLKSTDPLAPHGPAANGEVPSVADYVREETAWTAQRAANLQRLASERVATPSGLHVDIPTGAGVDGVRHQVFQVFHQVIFGVLFIVVVLALPGGLVDIWSRVRARGGTMLERLTPPFATGARRSDEV